MSIVRKDLPCNQAKDGEFRLACDAYGGEEKYSDTSANE